SLKDSTWHYASTSSTTPNEQICSSNSLVGAVWVKQNFAGLPCLQPFHSLGKIFHRDSVGNDRMKVKLSGFEQGSHLIPGLVHAATINALDGDAFEDDVFGEIKRNGLGGKSEERNASAATNDVESCSNSVGMSSHLEDHVHAIASCLFHHDGVHVVLAGIKDEVRLHFLGKAAAMFIDFDGKDCGRADSSSHGDRKKTDRSTASHGDRLGGNFSSQNRVNRVAERIEDRCIFQRNGGVELPDIRFRDDDVLGKGSVGIHADDSYVLTDVSFAGAALQALSASHMHFG